MNNIARRIIKFFAYFAGGIVILLAIAVGLFRLFLPRLPEYQEDIKAWASGAIGMYVEFTGMDARWGLSGPEIEFYNAELIAPETMARIIAAEQVSVGIALSQLLFDRRAVVDRVLVSDSSVEVRQLADGRWTIQGSPVEQLIPARENTDAAAGGGLGPIEITLQDIELNFLQPGDERPNTFQISELVIHRDNVRMAVDADVELPESLGDSLRITATQLLDGPPEQRTWDVNVELDRLRLANLSRMQPLEAAWFDSGRGDIDASLRIANRRVTSAAADLNLRNISKGSLAGVAISGHVEYSGDDQGWLVAANDFRATTAAGVWPLTSLRVATSRNADGNLVMLDASASYLNLADADVAEPWLNDEQRALLAQFDPSGVVRNLSLTVSDLGTDAPRFNVSARFDELGIAAHDRRPGARGFTGTLRADHSGGRLEIRSNDLEVTAPGLLGAPLGFDEMSGTIIWRHSQDRTTVLSDSIVLRNAFFDSAANVEVSLVEGQTLPVIDLESRYSISDLAEAGRYVPFMAKRPRMSEFFREGMRSGRVPEGRVRLYGPLDAWPFDNDEGQFLVESEIRDAVLVYQPDWPAAEIESAQMTIENMSLSSTRNRIVTSGNVVTNASVGIADFRNPFLRISAPGTGTLETLRQLSVNSPINDMLGGNLERISVTGDANLRLDMNIPIRDFQSFSFMARLQPIDGSVQMEGFAAPVTNLNGAVIIERENIASEALAGTFLGNPIAIKLSQAPASMPEFRAFADATGTATTEAMINELGLPLADRVTGATAFSARLMFPRGKTENPPPFTIQLASDLEGLAVALPRPLDKTAEEKIDLGATIEMPRGGDSILSTGVAADLLSWRVFAIKEEGGWDLDRGVVTFGPEPDTTAEAETRGLHLRGTTDYVHAQRWFEQARLATTRFGLAERIRSIDITVGSLHIIGQHLVDHRIRLDRSAREWFVELEGDDITAKTIIPYDLNSGEPIVVEAERLVLPGDDESDEEPTRIDPRVLPPISITAAEMAIGNRFLGAVDAHFIRTADGLESERLVAGDETFEITGSGRWVLDESDPIGTRSSVTGTLTSTDVNATMQRLDYNPGIVSDDLLMELDLSWSGGPNDKMLESLDGEVKVRIGKGQLEEIDPGAGRVFGLLSIAALPRRLSLDFRDVFGKGFGFDRIRASFTLVDGETYTCDLSLESPAAEIGIVGRAGLVSREYEQVAVVSANFGNALPVAGAIVAGPQVAAALLIFSQIFKKPLQEVSQVYYGISGTFDDPIVDSATPELFALAGAMAGCIDEESS